MTKSIRKQIAELTAEQMQAVKDRFRVGNITPYDYQVVMYLETAKRIKNYEHPFYLKASVSAGKTLFFAMVAAQCQRMNIPMLILARQAEIVEQDSIELTNLAVKNSVYCAGLNTKSAYFPIVVGSEGTVIGGIDKALGDYYPMVIGIDECHQLDCEDLADAIEHKESRDQMEREKTQPYMVNGVVVDKDYVPSGFDTVAWGTKRSQYTIIIMEFMSRCRERYGRELRIFGATGSEFRGVVPILVEDKSRPGFWREQVTDINTDYLVEFGSVVPTNFGDVEGLGYDLSDFHVSGQDGVQDFTQKQLNAMQKIINDDAKMTEKIMHKVVAICKNRNSVLITCAGKRHCEEAASYLPPGSTYCIITGTTGEKQRKAYLDAIFKGEIKYCFQVNALTTGVNQPLWDTSVILRKIASLTLLIQLLGRGMRQLKQCHIDWGFSKEDHLVLDFAGCMDEMGQLYFNPILEQQQFQNKFRNGKDPKKCEICGTMNSYYARRCMHVDSAGSRCEHFWTFQTCEDQRDERTNKMIVKGCGAKNDVVARICRCCDVSLKDPNEALSNKHYTKSDWFGVLGMSISPTKNQRGVVVTYQLEKDGDVFSATERFFPESESNICRIKWREFCKDHIEDPAQAKLVGSYKNGIKCVSMAHLFRTPSRTTHRRTEKSGDILAKKEFRL
jgi:superfamily II DNA or RNA helicase